MQTAGLGRKANLIAPRDRRLGGEAGNGDAMAADPGFEQDLGAELFDDLDAGIEAHAGRSIAGHHMFRPHAQDHAPAAIGREPRIGRAQRAP
ncbi:MAG: hypothetical protein QOJ86_1320 [Bradyrhizobium sp.]|nr:hypothetical protein [Bradyrhizobium sp.]